MIIDNTYFVGKRYIPHAKPSITDNVTAIAADIKDFIHDYEVECLTKCLGYSLARDFISKLDSTKPNGLIDGADEKWDSLLNGKEYTTPNGDLVKWEGIRQKSPPTNPTYNRSFLTDYVYFWYEKKDHQIRSGSGTQVNRSKNAETILPTDAVTKAMRDFINTVQGRDISPAVIETRFGIGVDWFQGGQPITLYKFINDSNTLTVDTYPNFNPKKWNMPNVFGI